MKKLVVFSHPSVLSINRALFQSIAAVGDLKLKMIVPKTWSGDLIKKLKFEKTPEDEGIDIEPVNVHLSGNGSTFLYSGNLKEKIREFSPDHVFVDEEPWSLAASQAYHAIGDFPKSFRTHQNLKKSIPLPFQLLEQWVFSNSTQAFAVSDEARQVLHAWKGFPKHCDYLPNSYDPKLFYPRSEDEIISTRRKLDIPEDSTVFAYFGRLSEEKGLNDLMAVMEELDHNPGLRNVFFLLVGNGPMAKEINKKIRNLLKPKAKLIQAIPHDEVCNTVASIDVLLLPSLTRKNWKEQFGRVLIEAMACKVPTIGSNSGEIPVLTRKTRGGLIFPEGDRKELLHQILRLSKDHGLAKKLASQGREYVTQNYTHDAVAKNFCLNLGFKLKEGKS